MFRENATDDFSVQRVPIEHRQSMWRILVIRVGALACISQILIGAAIGYGMTFWDALLATLLGSVVLQVVACALGIAGMREGLSTGVLARWAGFGRIGSTLVSAVFAISLTGWFGVQNFAFAEGLVYASSGRLSFNIAAMISGIGTTILVYFGFTWLSRTANFITPLFLFVMGVTVYLIFKDVDVSKAFFSPAPGPLLGLGEAATIIAGGFIVGCVSTPDLTRYAKSVKDVVWITVAGTFIGELGINLVTVLIIHIVGVSDIMGIIFKTTGVMGGVIVALATIKTNNLNLYSSSLGIAALFKALFNLTINRGILAIILGVVGTILSVLGIMDKFTSFLILLGVFVPPIAGVMIVDYFILKTWRAELDASRIQNTIPTYSETYNPVAFIAWGLGALSGFYLTWGVQSLTSIVVSAIAYYIGMKFFTKMNLMNLQKKFRL